MWRILGEFGAMDSGDLIEDAKFYQDTAIEYQSAYKALQLQQQEPVFFTSK